MATVKVVIYNDDGSALSGDMDLNSYVSKHLKLSEVANLSAKDLVKYVQTPETRSALKCWEYCREKWNRGITISGNYRTPSFNASVGGVSNSLHLGALAFDNQLGNVSDYTYNNWVRWGKEAAEKYGMCFEICRYKWGLHVAWGYRLPYTTAKFYSKDYR